MLHTDIGLKAEAMVISKIDFSTQEKFFMAGAATSNISPSLYGDVYSAPTITYVHDELHARALVLDDGETRLAFVVVDVIGLNRELIDEAKKLIHEEINLPVENIMISATHTHSARSARGNEPFSDYQRFVIRRIADAVSGAVYNLEPALIGWGGGNMPQHVFVRRWKMKLGTPIDNPWGGQDKVIMNPGRDNPDLLEPAGIPDPEIAFISVKSLSGRPIALFANYSLHYVGGVPNGHISADYFAVFADRIQELLGADRQDPPFVGIMSNGTSGDVNNINYAEPGHNYPSYERMRIVADDVAREVLRVHNTLYFHDWVRLQAAQEELTLKIRKPDRQMIENAKKVLSMPDTRVGPHRSRKYYNEGLLRRLEMPDHIDIIVQTFGIGELGIGTIPFETFAETGLKLKANSPFETTFIISLANGSSGYLPTPEQHELGGYETWTNRVEIEASRKIVSTILELFSGIK